MKGRVGWMAMAVLFMTAVAHATQLTVTDVKVAQRYPWNGLVDITYTVNCDDATKDVWVYPVGYDADNDKTVAMMPAHLTGDGAGKPVKSGTHRMTWDMATAMGANYNRAAFSVKMHAFCDAAPYMVIDLSSGSESERYEVSYLAEEPEGGWGEEYLTTKMVFRLILPGRSREWEPVDLSYNSIAVESPYYFALYPITRQQYALIAGGSDTSSSVMTGISYNMMRGSVLGSKWPVHQQVDADSVCGKMRLRAGMTFDLPTYAQWYRAASADLMHTTTVSPNAWGICGIGTVGEWTRDLGNERGTTHPRFVAGRSFSFESRVGKPTLGGSSCGYVEGNNNRLYEYDFTPDRTYPIYYSSISTYEKFAARLVVCPVSK